MGVWWGSFVLTKGEADVLQEKKLVGKGERKGEVGVV